MTQSAILLVDDEHESLTDVSRALRTAGYQVVAMNHGDAAMEFAQSTRPALVLADVCMPGLNGYQLCRKLKTNQKTQDIPVLLMSTKNNAADRFWAEDAGAVSLLPKTLAAPALVAHIASTLTQN